MLTTMLLTFQYIVEAQLSIYGVAVSSRCACMMFQIKVQDEYDTLLFLCLKGGDPMRSLSLPNSHVAFKRIVTI